MLPKINKHYNQIIEEDLLHSKTCSSIGSPTSQKFTFQDNQNRKLNEENMVSIDDLKDRIQQSLQSESVDQVFQRKKLEFVQIREKQIVEQKLELQRQQTEREKKEHQEQIRGKQSSSMYKSQRRKSQLNRRFSRRGSVLQQKEKEDDGLHQMEKYFDYEGEFKDEMKQKEQARKRSSFMVLSERNIDDFKKVKAKDRTIQEILQQNAFEKINKEKNVSRKVCMQVSGCLASSGQNLLTILKDQQDSKVVTNLTSLQSIQKQAKQEIEDRNLSKEDFTQVQRHFQTQSTQQQQRLTTNNSTSFANLPQSDDSLVEKQQFEISSHSLHLKHKNKFTKIDEEEPKSSKFDISSRNILKNQGSNLLKLSYQKYFHKKMLPNLSYDELPEKYIPRGNIQYISKSMGKQDFKNRYWDDKILSSKIIDDQKPIPVLRLLPQSKPQTPVDSDEHKIISEQDPWSQQQIEQQQIEYIKLPKSNKYDTLLYNDRAKQIEQKKEREKQNSSPEKNQIPKLTEEEVIELHKTVEQKKKEERQRKKERDFTQPFVDIIVQQDQNKAGNSEELSHRQQFLLSSCVGMLTLHQNHNFKVSDKFNKFNFQKINESGKPFYTIPYQETIKEPKTMYQQQEVSLNSNDKKQKEFENYKGKVKIKYINDYAQVQNPDSYILETVQEQLYT